jgi:hypothetical protein
MRSSRLVGRRSEIDVVDGVAGDGRQAVTVARERLGRSCCWRWTARSRCFRHREIALAGGRARVNLGCVSVNAGSHSVMISRI